MKPPPFERFSTGLLVGAVLSLALAWLLDSEVAGAIKDRWVEVLGIFAALLAAMLALLGVQKQIRVQTDQADAERVAQLRASLAVLPLVLSSLYSISETCIEVCLEDSAVIRDLGRREEFLRAAEVSGTHLDVLRDCIRFSDPVSAAWLSLIARQYQLCVSRYRSLVEGTHILLDINQHSMAINWSVFRAVVSHAFEFARGEVDQVALRMSPLEVMLPISSKHYGAPLFNGALSMLNEVRAKFGVGEANDYFG